MQIDLEYYWDEKANQIYELAKSKFDIEKLDVSGDELMDWCFEMGLMEEPKIVALLISKILLGKHVGTESVIADLITSFGYRVQDEIYDKAAIFISSKLGEAAVEEFRNSLSHPGDGNKSGI